MKIITAKRQTLLIVLLIALGGMLYFLGDDNKTAVEPTKEPISGIDHGQPAVSKSPTVTPLPADILSSPAGQSLNVKTGDDFFVEYRLERDRVRSRQISLLREIVDNPNSLAENRSEAQRQLLDITRRLEQELELENLILAKGYKEGVVFLQPMAGTIVLRKLELKQSDIVKIADLVSRITGLDLERITIIPKE